MRLRVPLAVAAAVAAVVALLPQAAVAATPGPTGVDLSYPNCGTLPDGADFAVIGLNGGVGTTTNPCFAVQRTWAGSLPGTVHGRTDVYLNTQNPKPSAASWWPAANATKRGRAVVSPYGACTGSASRACSWVYGASLAWDDLETRGVAGSVGRWWLDVELANDWDRAHPARNRAVLEGMTTVLRAQGQRVGLYSPRNEFPYLVGSIPASSALAGLPSWISHAADQADAERLCTGTPLAGGRITLVQWRDDAARLDRDVACATLTRSTKPTVSGSFRKGARLTAKPGTWRPSKVAFAYRWTRDGVPIAGATRATYTLRAADRSHRIAVEVTGTRTGYSRAVRISASHRVG